MQKLIKKPSIDFVSILTYFTLIVSIYYYITSFGWEFHVESFKLGVVIWPLITLFAIFIFLQKIAFRSKLLLVCAVFVIYNLIATLITVNGGLVTIITNAVYSLLWFALFVVFFNNSKKHGISKFFTKILWIAIPCCVVAFFILVSREETETTVKTLNPIFYFIYFLPLVLLEDNKIAKSIGVGFVFVATIVSNKRTAFIVVALVLLYIFLMYLKTNKKNIKKIFMGGLIAVGVISILYFLFIRITSIYKVDWLERFFQLEETGGSGRIDLWKSFFVDMKSATATQLLFGHGSVYPTYHNDLLQLIYDYGLVGSFFYVIMCCLLVVQYVKMIRMNYKHSVAYGTSLIIFFFTSSVGMVMVVHTWFLQMSSFWGIVLGDFYKECIKENIVRRRLW